MTKSIAAQSFRASRFGFAAGDANIDEAMSAEIATRRENVMAIFKESKQ
jgi:hypothetical protein